MSIEAKIYHEILLGRDQESSLLIKCETNPPAFVPLKTTGLKETSCNGQFELICWIAKDIGHQNDTAAQSSCLEFRIELPWKSMKSHHAEIKVYLMYRTEVIQTRIISFIPEKMNNLLRKKGSKAGQVESDYDSVAGRSTDSDFFADTDSSVC